MTISKRTKRAGSLLLALILLISITACSGGASSSQASVSGSASGQSLPDNTGAGSKAGTSDADTIKIGLIYALTGPNAKSGSDYVKAIELAADIINNKYDLNLPFAGDEGLPNLGGAKIELVIADHKSSPETGLAETERLITDKGCVAIIGAQQSAVAKTSSNAAERLGIPYLTPECTSKALTERGLEWFFRITPHDTTFVNDTYKFFDYLNENNGAGIKTVAIISEDTEYGAMLAAEEEELAPQFGYDVVEKLTYPANSTNVTSEVLRLKNSNPDAIIMASYVSDAILFMNTFSEQNYLPKVIVGQRAGYIVPEFLSALGPKSDYVFTTNVWALDLAEANPLVSQVNEMYRERAGIDLSGDYARAFTGLFVMADAINRAGSTEPEAIRQALRETDIKNEGQLIVPWEDVKFDEQGQNIYASGIITQAFDGSYKTVYPPENASAAPIVPMPRWDER